MTQEYVLRPAHDAQDLHINYATELNAQQLAAVTARGADDTLNSGPMLVIAGESDVHAAFLLSSLAALERVRLCALHGAQYTPVCPMCQPVGSAICCPAVSRPDIRISLVFWGTMYLLWGTKEGSA